MKLTVRDHPVIEEELKDITHLGKKNTKYNTNYTPDVLETFPNKHPAHDYFVKFNCPEFTSLCPMTGQPDFATIYISYVPGARMAESKSLKLYLFSFRSNYGKPGTCWEQVAFERLTRYDMYPEKIDNR